MIFTTRKGESFDTDKDLTSPERHVLQKLFVWEVHALNLDDFRQKKRDALLKGWNDSGPVMEGHSLKCIIQELEQRVIDRLNQSRR